MSLRSFLAILLVFGIYFFPSQCFSQNFAELEKTTRDELKEKNAVGAAVAVVKDGKIIFLKGFGAANAKTNAPVTGETLFQVGSVTKTFTAALILKMADESVVDIETPIGNYAKNLNPKLAKVNLKQLLSHTAGILDEPDEFGAGDESLMAPYIRSWKDDYALFNPGEVFSYSNSGFALAGLTAQEAAGKSYTDLMSEKIFLPLGMKSTTFRPTVAMTYPLAVGHTIDRDGKPQIVRPLPHDARLYPAGPFYTNLNDLSRFALAFLEGGRIDGKQVISASGIEKMTAPQARQLSADDDTSYGFGLFMNTSRGVRQYWHDGSMTGYTASMLFVPEQKFAVLILCNTNNVVLTKTQEKAMETVLKLKPQPASRPAETQTMTPEEMQQIAGVYNQPNRFNIEIYVKSGKLFIREFEQEMPLTKISENRYSFQFPRAPKPLQIYVQPARDGKAGLVHQYVWAFRKIS